MLIFGEGTSCFKYLFVQTRDGIRILRFFWIIYKFNLIIYVLIIDRRWDYQLKSEITQQVFFAALITAWIFSFNDCNSRHSISTNHLKACITIKFSVFFIFSSLEFHVFFTKKVANLLWKNFPRHSFFLVLSVHSLLIGKKLSRVLIILNYA